MPKDWRTNAPFHVHQRKRNGTHVGYRILCKNRPFLVQADEADVGDPAIVTPRLKRHEAYAIARVLNSQKELLKWAAKFGDPYV